MSRSGKKYRWVSLDGRRGRWRKTVAGAIMSAVGTANSKTGVAMRFDLQISLILWDDLKAKGWTLERSA